MPIPLYGFLEGDTIGLLILAEERETVGELSRKLQDAAELRVGSNGATELLYQGTVLNPASTVEEAGFAPLRRFDVRKKHGLSENSHPG
jgi:hypothetical protein